jgi:hypothetical protein
VSIPGPTSTNDHYEVPNVENDAFNDGVDPADAMDAAAFEALSQGINNSPSDLPRQDSTVEPVSSAILDDAGQPPTRSEADKFGVTVVIEHFPFGFPGAPIIGPPENATLDGPSLMGCGDSIWAPFCSQRDWEIARWAKMRNPTSSAVGDLLAIPEVRPACFHLR